MSAQDGPPIAGNCGDRKALQEKASKIFFAKVVPRFIVKPDKAFQVKSADANKPAPFTLKDSYP
jgi:hypothetical protein